MLSGALDGGDPLVLDGEVASMEAYHLGEGIPEHPARALVAADDLAVGRGEDQRIAHRIDEQLHVVVEFRQRHVGRGVRS